MIRDQRNMYGQRLATPAQVRLAWERMIGEVSRKRGEDIKLHQVKETVPAYVSHGRWVADCPECLGGMAAWPENEEGACMDCGAVVLMSFPPKKDQQKAEAVLAARRYEHTRNWKPWAQKVDDLKAENLLGQDLPAGFDNNIIVVGEG